MPNRNPTIQIRPAALLHNLGVLKARAPQAQVVAMVKANAYGCNIREVIPILDGHVSQFGVISTGEAMAIRQLGSNTPCLIMQGVFEPEEWRLASVRQFIYVTHCEDQLRSLLNTPLLEPVSVWIKVNTGMNRLGFPPKDLPAIMELISQCKWIKQPVVLMTHFANAEQASHPLNTQQIQLVKKIKNEYPTVQTSLANSAALFSFPNLHDDFIRPGLSLYGVSPFEQLTGTDLGLQPVMSFTSHIMHTFDISAGEGVGYGSTWMASRPSRLGIIPVGYGDGYPQVIKPGTCVWIQGEYVPIIGRISMDSMVIDLTDKPHISTHDQVELWGEHLPVERIAEAASAIPYELLCKVIVRPS